MKISVCLIVKNEEYCLERCLKCVLPFADEIVIVDTGSIDKTVEIAKKFTDKVYFNEWVNDFSKARNFAFLKATSDYLMWLDADDVILENEVQKIIKLKKLNSNKDVYMLKYQTLFDEKSNNRFEYYRERIIKNCTLAKFKGFIHESVIPFGEIEYCDITITHVRKEKIDKMRNINIYEYHINNGVKLNLRDEYYYAKEFFYIGNYSKCLEKITPLLNYKTIFSANLYDCYLTAYKCSAFLNDAKVDFLFEALKIFEPDSELLCNIADYYQIKGDKNRAIRYYKCALSCEIPSNKFIFFNSLYYYFYPLLYLVKLLYEVGDAENSYKVHKFMKSNYPQAKEVIYNDNFFSNLNYLQKN